MTTNNIPYRNPDTALDKVLRDELQFQAPPDLTHQLLHLVQVESPALQQQAYTATEATAYFHYGHNDSIDHQHPRAWYTILVTILTFMAVWVSSLVFWQISGQLGLEVLWGQVQTTVLNWLQQLYETLPVSKTFVSLLGTMYHQTYGLLNWVLVAVILWLVLDTYSPTSSYQHQPTP